MFFMLYGCTVRCRQELKIAFEELLKTFWTIKLNVQRETTKAGILRKRELGPKTCKTRMICPW